MRGPKSTSGAHRCLLRYGVIRLPLRSRSALQYWRSRRWRTAIIIIPPLRMRRVITRAPMDTGLPPSWRRRLKHGANRALRSRRRRSGMANRCYVRGIVPLPKTGRLVLGKLLLGSQGRGRRLIGSTAGAGTPCGKRRGNKRLGNRTVGNRTAGSRIIGSKTAGSRIIGNSRAGSARVSRAGNRSRSSAVHRARPITTTRRNRRGRHRPAASAATPNCPA